MLLAHALSVTLGDEQEAALYLVGIAPTFVDRVQRTVGLSFQNFDDLALGLAEGLQR
jgi:hypothetical protein